jgi:hypothetical protein
MSVKTQKITRICKDVEKLECLHTVDGIAEENSIEVPQKALIGSNNSLSG